MQQDSGVLVDSQPAAVDTEGILFFSFFNSILFFNLFQLICCSLLFFNVLISLPGLLLLLLQATLVVLQRHVQAAAVTLELKPEITRMSRNETIAEE